MALVRSTATRASGEATHTQQELVLLMRVEAPQTCALQRTKVTKALPWETPDASRNSSPVGRGGATDTRMLLLLHQPHWTIPGKARALALDLRRSARPKDRIAVAHLHLPQAAAEIAEDKQSTALHCSAVLASRRLPGLRSQDGSRKIQS